VFEIRKVQDVVPYDKNPRNIEGAIDKVLESLKVHGQIKPIVLSAIGAPFEQEVVCCGHTTLMALERFGAKEVKVVVHPFKDEAEFVDYNIRDNKTSEFAEWDDTVLAELSAEYDLSLAEIGFDYEIGDELDYSGLEDDDADDKADEMSDGVKKGLQIEFSNMEQYEESRKKIADMREAGTDVGEWLWSKLSENN